MTKMKFIGFIIEDYSLGWIRELNSYMLNNGKKIKRYNDVYYDRKVAKDFLYYCEKNGLCRDEMYQISIQVAKKIKNNKRIHYISVSCC